jgi:hypothetical protein
MGAWRQWDRTRQKEDAVNYKNLSPEQQEKAKACVSPEELAALAEEEGFELSDEMLEGIAGGIDLSECRRYRHICSRLTIHSSDDELIE